MSPHLLTLLRTGSGPWRILGAVAAWPVASQQQARRNALLASTALTDRRRERLEVEDFLAHHLHRHADRHQQTPDPHVHRPQVNTA